MDNNNNQLPNMQNNDSPIFVSANSQTIIEADQIPDKNEKWSFSIKKISEYLLLLLALVVIGALIFGLDVLGMIGMALFFVYGFCLVVIQMFKPILKAYYAKNYASAALITLVMGAALWVFGWMLYIGYMIVTLMLGFWEINS